MKKHLLGMLVCATLSAVAATANADHHGAIPVDGELALPVDYRSWPVYLKDVQRPDIKQVRDIYINPQGLKSSAPFAYGTTMVMELYAVKLDAAGKPELDAAGRLQRQALSKIFVMGKGRGWGQAVPAELRNGEWVYASFDAGGKSAGKDMTACRACHVPMKDTDFVARVTEFEKARGGGY